MVKYLQIFFLLLVSSIGLYYAFDDIEFSELFHHFASLDIPKFILSIIILLFACVIRAKRLKYIIFPLDSNITTHHLFGATMIGYFGNGILFFRLGELLKAYSISQGNNIRTSESFGVVMLERLIDALTVLFLLIFSLPFLPFENQTFRYWIIAFCLVTIVFVTLLFFIKFIDWESLIKSFSFLSESIRMKTTDVISKVFNGVELIFKTKYTTEILFSTIAIWVCYFFMTKWLLESCGILLDFHGVFIMLLIGAIVVSVPALPGGLGTYEAGITYALSLLFFVSKDLALTYAIISHASNYVPYVLVGFVYFLKSGIKISSVKKGSVINAKKI